MELTVISGLLGGILIGLASAALMLVFGRIAGISGIIATLLKPPPGDTAWRLWFLAGIVAGGAALAIVYPQAFATTTVRSLPLVAIAGLLVGLGTRLGSGCTSGHGVCGVSRVSRRSIVATLTFTAFGAATVTLLNTFMGSSL